MMSMVTPNPAVLFALMSAAEGVHFPTKTLWIDGSLPDAVFQNQSDDLKARMGSFATWPGSARIL